MLRLRGAGVASLAPHYPNKEVSGAALKRLDYRLYSLKHRGSITRRDGLW
jgi:hypothetical protein